MTTSASIPNSDAFQPVQTQTWVNGRHVMRCVRVIDETWDVKTFVFAAEQPLMFSSSQGSSSPLNWKLRVSR